MAPRKKGSARTKAPRKRAAATPGATSKRASVKQPAAKRQAAKRPAVKQPAAKQPAAKQPAATRPAAKRPPADAPVARQPTTRPDEAPRAAEHEATKPRFDPSKLDRTVIALPLEDEFKKPRARGAPEGHRVVIDLNLDYHGGRDEARREVIDDIVDIVHADLAPDDPRREQYRKRLLRLSPLQYVAARLTREQIVLVVRRDVDRARDERTRRRIYRVWPDFEVRACLTRSTMTVKADAARIAFNARGRDIVWAVMDSGIDASHPHFALHRNLDVKLPVQHLSFLDEDEDDALRDDFGHGTHVAGIIAGSFSAPAPAAAPAAPAGRKPTKAQQAAAAAAARYSAHGVREEESAERKVELRAVKEIHGVAPECKLVSMKVLDRDGAGSTTAIIRALQTVNEINQHGRRLLIHGVNLSLGYDFDPEWFACGQSPLCVEVDRLVRSGVVVVVAAGNSGYGYQQTSYVGVKAAGLLLSINDPGNAEAAITVGSTHREMPHLYGASFFSSKGPTGDGRNKPDILAPGEKIVSCAAGTKKAAMLEHGRSASSPAGATEAQVLYIEDSGTSMAAPHVSGAIAAFLSVRREFQGQPERVKQLFLDNATDLNRERYFQGRGLVDLMRTIQSV